MQETAISYNLKSAARATGISVRTLRRRIAAGELTARRVGTLIIIDAKDLARFFDNCPIVCPAANRTA